MTYPRVSASALAQYLEFHPEKDLLAFLHHEVTHWLNRVLPEEPGEFVIIAALNIVNCIAFVPLRGSRSLGARRGAHKAPMSSRRD